jgi:hypothetical protein
MAVTVKKVTAVYKALQDFKDQEVKMARTAEMEKMERTERTDAMEEMAKTVSMDQMEKMEKTEMMVAIGLETITNGMLKVTISEVKMKTRNTNSLSVKSMTTISLRVLSLMTVKLITGVISMELLSKNADGIS